MVFSFNFNIDKDVGTQEEKKEPESQKIEWKQAEEIFLSEEHFKRISGLPEIENFFLGDLNNQEKITIEYDISDEEKEVEDGVSKGEAVAINDSKEDGEQNIADNQNDSEKEKEETPKKLKFQFLNFINSETVTVNLKSCGYKGDLEKALDDNTDLVPGYHFRRI